QLSPSSGAASSVGRGPRRCGPFAGREELKDGLRRIYAVRHQLFPPLLLCRKAPLLSPSNLDNMQLFFTQAFCFQSLGCNSVHREPAVGEPAVGEPAVEEPAVGEPAVGEPAVGEPAVGEPAVGEPAVGEPAVGEPAVGEPAVGEPTVREPAVGEATVGEPAVGEATVGEPAVGEPATERNNLRPYFTSFSLSFFLCFTHPKPPPPVPSDPTGPL
uniref:Uncharacterized protein n=1 Tax=Seriola dumerili TaxID=41447 RepID=A0A3B4U7C9_SERDU